jgi:hypothetical protein
METLKRFGDKHISMDTHGQQYKTSTLNLVTQQYYGYVFRGEGILFDVLGIITGYSILQNM